MRSPPLLFILKVLGKKPLPKTTSWKLSLLRHPFKILGMPLTLDHRPNAAGQLEAAIRIRKQIAQLERKFSKLLANMPKYMLARNDFGFSPGEMKKIAQKLHAKAKQ